MLRECMADDLASELSRAHRETAIKYTYFLLASAGAAIALAVNQTRGTALAWSQVPLGAAVASWGLCFYMGCRRVSLVSTGLVGNIELVRIERGQHPTVGRDPGAIAKASKEIEDALKKYSKKASRSWHWQFRLLVTGAVLYLGWRVLEMGRF